MSTPTTNSDSEVSCTAWLFYTQNQRPSGPSIWNWNWIVLKWPRWKTRLNLLRTSKWDDLIGFKLSLVFPRRLFFHHHEGPQHHSLKAMTRRCHCACEGFDNAIPTQSVWFWNFDRKKKETISNDVDMFRPEEDLCVAFYFCFAHTTDGRARNLEPFCSKWKVQPLSEIPDGALCGILLSWRIQCCRNRLQCVLIPSWEERKIDHWSLIRNHLLWVKIWK